MTSSRDRTTPQSEADHLNALLQDIVPEGAPKRFPDVTCQRFVSSSSQNGIQFKAKATYNYKTLGSEAWHGRLQDLGLGV